MEKFTDEELGTIAIILDWFSIHPEETKMVAWGAKKRQWERVHVTI